MKVYGLLLRSPEKIKKILSVDRGYKLVIQKLILSWKNFEEY